MLFIKVFIDIDFVVKVSASISEMDPVGTLELVLKIVFGFFSFFLHFSEKFFVCDLNFFK